MISRRNLFGMFGAMLAQPQRIQPIRPASSRPDGDFDHLFAT